ncbi:DUF6476 family protein [Aestuariivita sp.]|jgi:hypothetical protein|uniref:DUF6476 family protein n=1 Tax=Aestuariivita sp. TaxID=1872407 RepID=UPI00216C4B40|nr:DUF6476 family protein [Aestuariivita sp.]MCE8009810.1 hypothetical protein [Aestuariivita sp.]
MQSPSDNLPEPPNLRFLRRLVTVLTLVMIGGLLVITSLLVIRFSQTAPALPDDITLPDGTSPQAFTQGTTWYAVVTTDNRILIYDRLTGTLTQTVQID